MTQEQKNKDIISKINKDKQKAKLKRLKSLGKDPSLLFLPLVSESILQKLIDIDSTFSNLESDIEQLNEDINTYNQTQNGDKQSLINRKNALYNQLNFIEKKTLSINKLIKQLNTTITIFKTITTTLKLLPLPTAPVPITLGIINSSSSLLEKINKTMSAFKTIISLIENELSNIKENIIELKKKIKNIEDKIENPNLLLSSNTSSSNINSNVDEQIQQIQIGTYPETYRGFKFAIKEENNINAPKIQNLKRHYAVAIDNSGVEVLKSDISFTLNPQVLIEQLKLIIDQNDLKP